MRFFSTSLVRMARAICVFAAAVGFSVQAHAFTHPCIPTTLQELDTIKANLDKQPWKSGYAGLLGDWHSLLTYQMGGPFELVSRNPHINLTHWRNDMVAIYNMARLWYFTGNEAYAQKAHDILIAWATVNKTFTGQESGLDLGDYAICYAGGASILRGTWPGWTEADTAAVKNWFENVLWPGSTALYYTLGPANKGALCMASGMAIATFLDDTDKVNFLIDQFRASASSGLRNTIAIGEMGETGRDAGHAYGDIKSKVLVAEIAWKMGIDLYSEMDNRLLAAGEYYARNTFIFDNPFVPYGTIDWTYYENAEGPYNGARDAFFMLQNAYKNRKGLPTPWIDKKMEEQGVDGGNFMFARTADFTTATPPAPLDVPAVSLTSGSGLTLTTLGTRTAGRSASYSNGVWTVSGLGNGVWSDTADDCQFVYTSMTGDCAMVARVTSCSDAGASSRAGLMIRDNLTATVSKRCWVSLMPGSPNKIEVHMRGWTQHWGGSNRDDRSIVHPPGMPYWLKVERRGNMISTYSSPDGTSWAVMLQSWYASLPATLNVGLFTNSGNTTPITATFDNVAFTGGTGGLVTTPAPPAAMFATGSHKAITARWLPSFGATGYDLLRSTTSGSGYTLVASDLTADKTSYVDTDVAPGTTYYYVARAKNSAGTSGNSPEFYAALLPPPLVNLATTGTATDDLNSSPTTNAAGAFDQNPGSLWFHSGGTTGWLRYDFGAGNAQIVKRYTVNAANLIPERDPKDWQFQASNDGVNWTTLDTQSGQAFTLRMQMKTYDLANTTAYRFYRFNVTANNGHADILHLGDIGLWGDSGRTIPDGTYVVTSRKSHKVMGAFGDGTANGTPVVQRPFTGGNSQQWTIQWQGNGEYRVTGVASAKVIDNGGSSSAGANLVIQPSSGSSGQRWKITPDSDGFFRITSASSGLTADVSGGSTSDDANMVQNAYTGGDSQLWMPGLAVAPQPAPSAPVSVTATPASISQINLSWTASPGAVSYNVKRATVNGGPYTTIAVGVNTTGYADTYLTASTTYYYVVSAVNGSGEGADSTQAQATTQTGPPPAPTGLTATPGTNRAVLSWTATGGATSYTVKRATVSGGPYTTIATGVTSPTYTDTGRTTDVAYYYVVVAVNAHGSGPNSAEVAVGPGTLSVHLAFDETSGTTAADSSGRGHHSTLINGPSFVAGFLANALDLPATAYQTARLPDGITGGLTDFTIATWIKVDTFATWARIFDFGTGTGSYMFLTAQGPAGARRPRFSIRSSSVAEQNLDSSIALPAAGTWAHVAVTRSGNTNRLYVNGTLAGTATASLAPADLGFTTRNYLGKSQFNDPYLNADLDDFRIHTHAMSQAEITALAHPPAGAPTQLAVTAGDSEATLTWVPNATATHTVKRSTTSGGPYATIATGVTGATYTDSGLANGVTYYYVVSGANADGSGPDSAEVSATPGTLHVHIKFDETSGATAVDSSGRAQHATLVNGPAFGSGRINNALGFTAASTQHATFPSGLVSGLSDFTISTWIKPNTFATWARIFDFGTATNNYMFLTAQGPAGARRPRFGIRTPSVGEQFLDSSIALGAGVWTHIAVTRSGTTVSLYVNGSPAGSGTVALSPSDLGATNKNYLGKSQFNDPYLNAALDDFRIYSHAMSASEITSLASPLAAPQNLVATPGPLSLDLSWNAVPDATRYTVKYSTTSGGPYTTLASSLASTSYPHSGLSYGTVYYYVVSAGNSFYDGPSSAELAATPDSALIGEAEATSPRLVVNPASGGDPATVTLTSGTSVPGHNYQLQSTTDLAAGIWFDIGDPEPGTGAAIEFIQPHDESAQARFYRILISR